jgi:hypothetical protein
MTMTRTVLMILCAATAALAGPPRQGPWMHGGALDTAKSLPYLERMQFGAISMTSKKATGVDVADATRTIVVKAEKHPTKLLAGLPLYKLTVDQYPKDTAVNPKFNPCGDRAESDLALYLDGYWDAKGAWQQASGKHTFVCWVDDPLRDPPVEAPVSGAIAKCIGWGYSKYSGEHRDIHQACTRMARADYCGDGTFHTVPGMAIDFEDVWGLEVLGDDPGATKVKQVEALWTRDGAYCVDKTRLKECQKVVEKCPGYHDGAEDLKHFRCRVRTGKGPIILMNLMRREKGKDQAKDAVCP